MTNWRQKSLELCGDVLRFSLWGVVLIDAMLLAIFSAWFVARFLWHLRRYLLRVLFDTDW